MTKKRKLARSVTGRGLAVLLLMLALSPSTAWAEDLLKEEAADRLRDILNRIPRN